MSQPALDDLPGFRRRFIVRPDKGSVSAAVEDDYHCMAVTIRHDGKTATAIEPIMERAPWTTCPGAVDQLIRTFVGVALDGFADRGEKTVNCTHLHDLAVLGAAHANDAAPLVYDILASDPVDGVVRSELRRDGVPVMAWSLEQDVIVEPAEASGLSLFRMGKWIDSLEPEQREVARVLRWGTMIAHGRTIPMEHQSDATKMPPNCHTFQPHNAALAERVGGVRDFSDGIMQPLDRLSGSSGRTGSDIGLPFASDAA